MAKVHRREELYSGPQLAKAPDLVVEAVQGYELKANLGVSGLLAEPERPGCPSRNDALFYISGIKEGLKPEPHRLEDLAPTLLALLGLNAPPAWTAKACYDPGRFHRLAHRPVLRGQDHPGPPAGG